MAHVCHSPIHLPNLHLEQHVAMTGCDESGQLKTVVGCLLQRMAPPGAPIANATARTSTTCRTGEQNLP